MIRVLVTGANGFIGQSCLPILLDSGFEVHAISCASQPAHNERLVWHKCNLLDARATGKVVAAIKATHLLHLAWYAVPGKFWWAEVNKQWVHASMNLFRHFAEQGGERIVSAGSCAEYDWQYGSYIEDKTPLNPSTLYGECKKQLFCELARLSTGTKISTSWGRIFFAYGPGEHRDRLIPSVILSLLEGRDALCSEGGQLRDFLYVHDVASAFIMLLKSGVEGAVNIGSSRPVEVRQVARMIAAKLGRESLLRLGALPMQKGEPDYLVADNARLTEEVGWHAEYSLSDGLDQAIRWWSNERRYKVV